MATLHQYCNWMFAGSAIVTLLTVFQTLDEDVNDDSDDQGFALKILKQAAYTTRKYRNKKYSDLLRRLN